MYYIDRILDHRSNGAKTEYHVLWEATEMTPTGDSTWESSDRVRRTQAFRDYQRQQRMGHGVHVGVSECEWPLAVEQMLESAGVDVHELNQETQDRFAQARF